MSQRNVYLAPVADLYQAPDELTLYKFLKNSSGVRRHKPPPRQSARIPTTLMTRFICWLVFILLSACNVGPDYQKPDIALSATWDQQPPLASAHDKMEPREQWWKDFSDPTMNELVALALENNTDRRIAAQRVLQARGAAQGAFGALFPSVQGDIQASRGNQQQVLYKYPMVSSYQPTLDASYELDLFGGNRRNLEASEANVQSMEANYFDTTITLIAEVVTDYVRTRALQHQLILAKKTAETQRHIYDLTRNRFKAGASSRFDTTQAEAQYKTRESRIPDFQRQIAVSGYQLEILIGVMPNALKDKLEQSEALPQPKNFIVMDTPADVIARRPDVRKAERALANATALQGVAISNLYPHIGLSALFGYNKTNVAPGSQIWSAGGNLVTPLFNFQSLEGQIDTADAQQKEALERYRQAVLQALADVEGGMASLKRERERNQFLSQAVTAAKASVSMAEDKYKVGTATMTDVLQAEQQLYSNESDLILSKANLANNVATLNKALGLGPAAEQIPQPDSWWLF